MGAGSAGLGFIAGVLSTLSPCVLPLLPLVFGAAVAAHRFGVLALAGGLMVSFVAIGLFVATLGLSLGLEDSIPIAVRTQGSPQPSIPKPTSGPSRLKQARTPRLAIEITVARTPEAILSLIAFKNSTWPMP